VRRPHDAEFGAKAGVDGRPVRERLRFGIAGPALAHERMARDAAGREGLKPTTTWRGDRTHQRVDPPGSLRFLFHDVVARFGERASRGRSTTGVQMPLAAGSGATPEADRLPATRHNAPARDPV
jgi:hypothetical protein